ncbi:Sorting nexin mvp1 [Xylographa vitiligo]|nr:Sorting nexin mvp1 [Xylographa vitiligo]
MSLFGSSPDESSQHISQSKSLFDDEPTPDTAINSSLFADETGASDGSPWGMPTPKKAARSDLVKTLLPASDVPESYIDAYDAVLDSGDRAGAGINIDAATKMLQSSKIRSTEQGRLLQLVTAGGSSGASLSRSEFNVLLALIGLAQENEEATLDGVDERRKNLPEPSIPYLKNLKNGNVSERLGTAKEGVPAPQPPKLESRTSETPAKSRRIRKDSLEDIDADPWSSPAMHKGHTHIVSNDATPKTNGTTAARPITTSNLEASRTTSAFTTHSEEPNPSSGGISGTTPSGNEDTRPISGGWGGYDNANAGFPNGDQPDLGAAGFGNGGDDSNNPSERVVRSLGGGRTTNRGVEEMVTITMLPEKEGIFMFQHHNYEVKSARRASTVVRRYSDFVWLLDCLYKRYPFRQLPLLPPKTLAVNGRHLSSDVTFIEKRRRGLVRFTNALVRHPVLSQEQLVVMFLTVPTELAVWRKQATISVQEEFTGKSLPPGLEDSLPTNLNDMFDTVRAGVKRSAETYIALCNLMERLAKRNQGVAADYLRFSTALKTLTDESESTYATDTNDVPMLNEGIKSTAKHLETSHSLLEDEARAWDEGVLEDLKRQRDSLVSVRDMFDRRDRYAKTNIPQLERRIESNETKLSNLKGRPEGSVKPEELQRVEDAIFGDKQSIVNQHTRSVLIKECMRDELIFFQQSQYHISKLHQDWSQERVKYAELQADNWRALSEEVDNMPTGE